MKNKDNSQLKDYSKIVDAYNNGQPLTKEEISALKERAKNVVKASKAIYKEYKKIAFKLHKQAKKKGGVYQESEEFLRAKEAKKIAVDAQDIGRKINGQRKYLKNDREFAKLGVLVDVMALDEDRYENVRTLYNKQELKRKDFHAGQEFHGLKYMKGQDKVEDLYNKRSERAELNVDEKVQAKQKKLPNDNIFTSTEIKEKSKKKTNDEVFTSTDFNARPKKQTKDFITDDIKPKTEQTKEVESKEIDKKQMPKKEMPSYSSDLPKIELNIKRNTKNKGLAHGEDGNILNRQ